MLQSMEVRELAESCRLTGRPEPRIAPHPTTGPTRPAATSRREPAAPSPRERKLLRLWARGYTDQRAARELEVSLRTVRRMSASLMERYGVHSRFQVGGLAHQRGWISLEDLF
ncbi:transcriptional regulator, LuxR family [Stackebrandtia nassauensis DSM 44728]|uniref:Transcriptional regulator, LuxR family n=2 Tax=Stackebrandtia TaxID=283810 RepID=D3Q4H5_STANL|nr:transcriptional regulator, LuxR family [Stackebrandtia nassauensis DSM 44728]